MTNYNVKLMFETKVRGSKIVGVGTTIKKSMRDWDRKESMRRLRRVVKNVRG
jgi:hypothetical protein